MFMLESTHRKIFKEMFEIITELNNENYSLYKQLKAAQLKTATTTKRKAKK